MIQQRAQHPRGLFIDLHTLGQQIRRRLITDFIKQREDPGVGKPGARIRSASAVTSERQDDDRFQLPVKKLRAA